MKISKKKMIKKKNQRKKKTKNSKFLEIVDLLRKDVD